MGMKKPNLTKLKSFVSTDATVLRRRGVAVAAALATVGVAGAAFATDPTYTSAIGEQLGSISTTSVQADMALFGGEVIDMALIGIGVMFTIVGLRMAIKPK